MNFKYLYIFILIVLIPFMLFAQSISKTNFSGVVGSGARAFGMGGAFIAIADDATAASWNPGGIGQLEKPEFSIVINNQSYSCLFPAKSDGINLTGPQDFSGTAYAFDFASFTFPFRIGGFKIVPQVSYQRAVSFNSDSKLNNVVFRSSYYDKNKKRYVQFNGSFTFMDQFTGGFDIVSVSLGSKVFRGVNIGVSTNIWMNGYEGERAIAIQGTHTIIGTDYSRDVNINYSTEKTLDISGVNFNVGALIEILSNLKIGAVYKTAFNADITYDNFAQGELLSSDFSVVSRPGVEYSGTATLEWPATWGVGLAFAPVDEFTFSLDYTYTEWSKAMLRNFNNAETEERQIDVYFPTFRSTSVPDAYKQTDTNQIRFGMEYVYVGDEFLIPFRLGLFTDKQYYKDSSGEDITFIGITGGLGLKYGPLSVDFAVQYESGSYLETNYAYSATEFNDVRIFVSTIFSF